MLARFASCMDFLSHRLIFTACVMVLLILLGALTTELLQLQPTSWLCSDRPSQMGRDVLWQISLQRPSTYFSS
jgi:EamA domain-containing membrane protein RarD